MFIIEILLIFVLPGIAALVAVGSVGRKIWWYIAAAGVVFVADILMGAVFIALRTLEKDSSIEPLLTPFVMLIAGIATIALAAKTGKKCPACQSRIHPKATRCPKCQTVLA